MNPRDKKEEERPVAYPKPTKTDLQIKNQPEFIDEDPNHYQKEVGNEPDEKQDEGRD